MPIASNRNLTKRKECESTKYMDEKNENISTMNKMLSEGSNVLFPEESIIFNPSLPATDVIECGVITEEKSVEEYEKTCITHSTWSNRTHTAPDSLDLKETGYVSGKPCRSRSRKPEYAMLKKYVKKCGGLHVILRILIANNGNAAVKAIRSFREWTFNEFGTDRFLEIVVMATQDDIEANAEYISEGDFLVEVPGGPSENNYSNIPLIVQIAEEYECDGVWAGWGHASENPKFPIALESSLQSPKWIGPSAISMELLGDKIGSTLIAQSLGIACVPWSGSDVTCDVPHVLSVKRISDVLIKNCSVSCIEDVIKACDRIGFPVVIKASSGGGGRGIRQVFRFEDIESAYYQVISEVKDSLVFVMKLLRNCRHLEVQIVGDRLGHVTSIGTRDCTVQRRCQKIIEECPATIAPENVILQMEKSAIKLLSAVGYLTVATCEFLYDPSTKMAYFLEVNPRLQVEHVVTEVVFQINLPAIQLQTALGIPLENISDLRKAEHKKKSRLERHCIAARITAEHAEENFRPTSGQVVELQLRSSMNAWGYFFLGVSGQVHRFADSQIGHVFAVGGNREEARRHLVMALKRLTVRGEIHTNVEALLKILELPVFIDNACHTTWIEECLSFEAPKASHAEVFSLDVDENAVEDQSLHSSVLLAVALAAACESYLVFKRSQADFVAKIHQGQLPPLISGIHSVELVHKSLRFGLQCFHTGACTISVALNDSSTELTLRPITLDIPPTSSASSRCSRNEDELTSSACFLISGGPDLRSRRVFYKIDAGKTSVTFDGSTFAFAKENDPTQVRAPVSGRLSRWLVPTGTPVKRGDAYADIEIMKMYMQLQVSDDGILSHTLAEGAVFKAGDLLATLDLGEHIIVQKYKDYVCPKPFMGPKVNKECYKKGVLKEEASDVYAIRWEYPKRVRKFHQAKHRLECILKGYQCTTVTLQETFDACVDGFLDPIFPTYELINAFATAELPIPTSIMQFLKHISPSTTTKDATPDCFLYDSPRTCESINHHKKNYLPTVQYHRCLNLRNLRRLFKLLEQYIAQPVPVFSKFNNDKQNMAGLQPLSMILQKYQGGFLLTAAETIVDLLTQYLNVEEVFHKYDNDSTSKVLLLKRTELDAEELSVLARSHQALSQKNDLVIQLLGVIRQYYHYFMNSIVLFNDVLQRLSRLTKPKYASVSLRARQLLLMRHQQPFFERTLALTNLFSDLVERRYPLSVPFNSSQKIGNITAVRSCHVASTLSNNNFNCSFHSIPDNVIVSSMIPAHHHSSRYVNALQRMHSGGHMVVSPALKSAAGSLGMTPIAGTHTSCGIDNLNLGMFSLNPTSVTDCHTQTLQTFVDDWETVADDSLISLLAHPNPQFNKLALQVFVRRHFEQYGLHEFHMGYAGEFWWRRALSAAPSQDYKLIRSSSKHEKNLESFPSAMHVSNSKIIDSTVTTSAQSFETAFPPVPPLGSTSKRDNEEFFQASNNFENVKPSEIMKNTEAKFLLPSVETGSRDQTTLNTAGLQRINRLLAVWMCSAVLTYDFLTQCCDVLTENGPITPDSDLIFMTKKNTMTEASNDGSMGTTTKKLKSFATGGDVHNPMSLFVRNSNSNILVSSSEAKCSIPKNEEYSNFATSKGIFDDFETNAGVHSKSRLHHMLNAFACSPNGESSTGQLQMVVAMAFTTFESFSSNFPDCLQEYSELQNFMPPAPSTVDGKILLVFISEVNDNKNFGSSSSSSASSIFVSPNCSTWLETECQSHGEQLAALGFHLLCFCFLTGAHLKTLRFEDECYRGTLLETESCVACAFPSHDTGMLDKESNHCQESISCYCCDSPDVNSISQPTTNGNDPFDNFDLICSRSPLYLYFRNMTALPHLSSSNVTTNKTITLDTASGNADYTEEVILRHVSCCQFHSLELKRLINFQIKVEPVSVPHIHLFLATPKTYNNEYSSQGVQKRPNRSIFRFFVRILLHYQLKQDEDDWADLERHFVAGLNSLELTLKNKCPRGQRPPPSHHILMSVIIQGPTLQAASTNLLQSQTIHRIAPTTAQDVAFALAQRYESRLIENDVGTFEVRFVQRCFESPETIVPIRIVITNPTRQSLQVEKFVEITDPTTGEHIYSALDASDSLAIAAFHSSLMTRNEDMCYQGNNQNCSDYTQTLSKTIIPGGNNSTTWKNRSLYDGLPVSTPHPFSGPLDEKRALAASLSTIYIYDFLELFEESIKKQWQSCPKYFIPLFPGYTSSNNVPHRVFQTKDTDRTTPMAFIPDKILEYVELVLDENAEIHETSREPGQNDCGMVAWRVLMRTPEFPRGRRMILVGNDLTFQMGTFGIQEDLLYQRVSQIARKEGIPRIYIAANSGARMGLAKEVQDLFQVEWIDSNNPAKGFKSLYVDENDYQNLCSKNSIVAESVLHNTTNTSIYRLTSVIGSEMGLGVENLCGSGAIAGETSRSYNSNVTITFVTGRTVGIGAYISRLGHRVIQKASSAPILLTGYQVINRLSRRDVYTSNDELGGVDVMAKNGVTHIVVGNDIEGCEEIVRWLSYVPEHRDGALPIMVDPTDPITRPVLYRVSSLTEDPRLMLTGCLDAKGQWLGGIFDRGSFREVLADWAKSVIVGRARLGGIPVGVIAVETRVTETVVPADSAIPDSVETTLLRPGQMWFPDSAYKTAQAISDFNREEIPLIIFANWRGFSGGQRDMFHEVLKFGSFIVDALVNFKQPCIVYIPPKAELRGGAWVVVDPRINPHYMDMFADPDCRAGVLEPTGIVEIKFRDTGLASLAERLDPVLKQITHKDQQLAVDGVALDDSRRTLLKESRDKRLQDIIPIYKQVAVYFADLHDTAPRMKKTDAIQAIVPWERSRVYFYWRLRRQLIFFNLRSEIIKVNPTLNLDNAETIINQWEKESRQDYTRSTDVSSSCEQNIKFVQWACHALSDISRRLATVRMDYQRNQLVSLIHKTPQIFKETILSISPNALPNTKEGACLLDIECNTLADQKCEDNESARKPEVGLLDDCSHIFHASCIETWSTKDSFCPQCKQRFERIGFYTLSGFHVLTKKCSLQFFADNLTDVDEEDSIDEQLMRRTVRHGTRRTENEIRYEASPERLAQHRLRLRMREAAERAKQQRIKEKISSEKARQISEQTLCRLPYAPAFSSSSISSARQMSNLEITLSSTEETLTSTTYHNEQNKLGNKKQLEKAKENGVSISTPVVPTTFLNQGKKKWSSNLFSEFRQSRPTYKKDFLIP